MLRRDDGEQTEFITLSMWESRDAIRAFAGEDIEAAVLYPEDERFLIDGRSHGHPLRGRRPGVPITSRTAPRLMVLPRRRRWLVGHA